MTDTRLSVSKMYECIAHQRQHGTQYGLGSKPPSLDADATSFDKVDCSGESRWLCFKATSGDLVIPDGSYTQKEWFASHGYKAVKYSDIQKYGEGRLFIAFEDPHPIGHVWFVDGTTRKCLESHGHRGPDSTRDMSLLSNIVSACYEVPCKE